MGSRDEGGRRWGSFHSRRFCLGLYCLAERTVLCAETACTCKSLENGFSFFFFCSPPFWLHPSPLTDVLGSQGADVLLSGPFPFFTPWSASSCQGTPLPHITELNVFDLSGKKQLITMAEGLSFDWPSQDLQGEPSFCSVACAKFPNTTTKHLQCDCSVLKLQ